MDHRFLGTGRLVLLCRRGSGHVCRISRVFRRRAGLRYLTRHGRGDLLRLSHCDPFARTQRRALTENLLSLPPASSQVPVKIGV